MKASVTTPATLPPAPGVQRSDAQDQQLHPVTRHESDPWPHLYAFAVKEDQIICQKRSNGWFTMFTVTPMYFKSMSCNCKAEFTFAPPSRLLRGPFEDRP